MIFIGVDPSFRKGGFAVCIINRRDNTATMRTIKDLGEFLQILNQCQPTHVTVENSNLQNLTFDLTGGALVAARKSRDVGKNQAISQCATDIAQTFCTYRVDISPKQKGRKIENESLFQAILRANNLTTVGYKGNKTEQDKRDALMLALIAEQQYTIQNRKRND